MKFRWWFDREEERPEGLSRRRFLFLGLGAAAGFAASKVVPELLVPAAEPIAVPMLYNDYAIGLLFEKYRSAVPLFYRSEDSFARRIMAREIQYITSNETIRLPKMKTLADL